MRFFFVLLPAWREDCRLEEWNEVWITLNPSFFLTNPGAAPRAHRFGRLLERAMTKGDSMLWQDDKSTREELVLKYLPLVDVIAKRIAKAGRCNWEDLRQEGTIGLLRAIEKYDPTAGKRFEAFAKYYISGAIFDSSELTRELARRQDEIYRAVIRSQEKLFRDRATPPGIDEVAETTGFTSEQILNAIDARRIAFAEELPAGDFGGIDVPQIEKKIYLNELIDSLGAIEQQIIRLYYLKDWTAEQIGGQLAIKPGAVQKTRQRALGKLRKRLGALADKRSMKRGAVKKDRGKKAEK